MADQNGGGGQPQGGRPTNQGAGAGKAKAKRKAARPQRDGRPITGTRLAKRYTEAKSAVEEMTMMHCDYVHHLIDPDGTDATRVPDGVTATSAVFKTPTVKVVGSGGIWDSANAISTPPLPEGAGESIVGVFPGVAGSIWMTSGNEHTVQPSGEGGVQFETCIGLIDEAEPDLVQHARHAIMDCQHAVLPRFSTGELTWVYEVEVHTAAELTSQFVALLEFNSRDKSSQFEELVFTLRTRAHQTGVWTTDTAPGVLLSSVTLGNDINVNRCRIQTLISSPDYIDAFSVSVTHATDTKALDGDLTVKLIAGPEAIDISIVRFPSYSSTHFTVDSWADLDSLSATSAERVTALACLLTYMGSTLQNGGTIAGARLATGITIQDAPDGDIFSYLSGLPFYAADFALKDGCYAWWAPDSAEEQFFTPYNQPPMNTRNKTSLWFAANRDNISQTLRARVTMGIETITRARTYNSRIGPVCPTYGVLLALAKSVPAVTENPLHSLLGDAWKGFKDLVGKRSTWDKIANFGLDAIF